MRAKNVSMGFQFAPQLFEIVDFTIKDHPYGFFLIRHRLMTAVDIDDGKSPKPQAQRTGKKKSVIIRPSMNQRSSHPLDIVKVNRATIRKVVLTANSAHGILYIP